MQIYKYMDIGTDKVTEAERENIPHYMLNLKHPKESFTTFDFQKYVRYYIEKVSKKKKTPIIVGGSGLYIQTALYDYNFSIGKRDEKITKQLEAFVEKHGIKPLY